ncbi:cytochrome P450 [Mycolicibacterium hodleri]|uniref:Cytochrome P450 n=1 Tax=Mycolicibacterium hodleri TaxID=49897 RepID=A0A502ED15_9MYCO|nr:cytochrome P450 [Mycolicibacterium hodleri]TPG35615.1 cytochrome P450 [Mycolicibacterium hodleri]
MTKAISRTAVDQLPLAPRNPLPLRRQLEVLRSFHTGPEILRDAGGPVTRIKLVPSWLMPEIVLTTSPQGAHDVLGTSDAIVERNALHHEMRSMIGANLFVVPHDEWLPRRRLLQPLFTKKHVRDYGGPMAESAETIALSWGSSSEVDLDVQCRKLTLRALGRSVLGLDLDDHADRIAQPLQVMLKYVADRAIQPVRMPSWVFTPARRRARAASAELRALASEVLTACREHADVDAPLVRSLIDARDPSTGEGLSDADIRDELIVFMGAGHDTTATTMAYALWQLGWHPAMQERLRAEVDAVGDRRLTPDDLGSLHYTVQVLHEALRLCPPGAMNGRLAMQDIEVDGYRVRAGTFVTVGVYALQRDPNLWDRAAEFDPDRFGPEFAKDIDRWKYLPFGAGPRTCVGDHFAMLELALALATIVRHVEIQSLEPEFPMATPFTTVAAAPIRARVTRRSLTTP